MRRTMPAKEEWLKTYSRGMSNGRKWKIDWASEDERFVLVHIPGETCYDPLMGTRYSSGWRELIDITTDGKLSLNCSTGTKIKSFEGRFSKRMVSDILEAIGEYENNAKSN